MDPFLLSNSLKNLKLHTWTPFAPHVFRFIKISFNQLIAFIICEPLLAQKHLLISTAGAVYYNLKIEMNSDKNVPEIHEKKKQPPSLLFILEQCFTSVGERKRYFTPFLVTST